MYIPTHGYYECLNVDVGPTNIDLHCRSIFLKNPKKKSPT